MNEIKQFCIGGQVYESIVLNSLIKKGVQEKRKEKKESCTGFHLEHNQRNSDFAPRVWRVVVFLLGRFFSLFSMP